MDSSEDSEELSFDIPVDLGDDANPSEGRSHIYPAAAAIYSTVLFPLSSVIAYFMFDTIPYPVLRGIVTITYPLALVAVISDLSRVGEERPIAILLLTSVVLLVTVVAFVFPGFNLLTLALFTVWFPLSIVSSGVAVWYARMREEYVR